MPSRELTEPRKGLCYVETGKGIRLYCHGIEDGHVQLSYGPDSPVSVYPRLDDFQLFFEPAPPISIGDVAVWRGMPPGGNPYKNGGGLIGASRKAALWVFRRDGVLEGYTFWYAPSCGGAQRLYDAMQVNWGDWTGGER
jgi:hypothetical protein